MSDLSAIFNAYFVSACCLFWNFIKGLMVAGVWAIILRGLCRLLMWYMIEIEAGFLEELFYLVSQMFYALSDLEQGILMILIFAFSVRMVFDWIKRIRYV